MCDIVCKLSLRIRKIANTVVSFILWCCKRNERFASNSFHVIDLKLQLSWAVVG